MKRQDGKPRLFSFTLRDFLIFAAIFICALVLCTLLRRSDISDGFASPVFVLAVLLTSRFTNGYLFGTLAAFLSVIGINYIFTFPYWEFNFTMTGYPLTFFVMLCVSLVTCTMTTKIKQQEQFRMESEREKMRANLLRSISHDLRTPLTSIIGASSSLTNDSLNLSEEERTHLMRNITEDAAWLLNMVENILSVTKIQDDNRTLKKSSEPLEEIMSDSVHRVKRRIPDANIQITLPDEFVLVPMDALLIEQVIINLLENALKHSHSKKPIELYATIEPKTVTVYVKDYGIGISNDKKDEIFKSYTRRNNSPDRDKGMGIGLSICQTIIEAHNGEIHADTHDEGSIFYFSLPKED